MRFGFETLEERRVLTTTLFLDFGAGIGMGNTLSTDVDTFRDIFGAGANNNGTGSDMTGEGMAGGDSLDFTPLAYDFNGDSVVNNADITALANAVLPIVQRALEPLDINVVVAAATSFADAVASVGANAGDATGEFDAYNFVMDITSDAFGGGDVGANTGLFGIAALEDLAAQTNNLHDEATLTFLDNVFDSTNGAVGSDTFNQNFAYRVAYTATHEAFHTYSFVHTTGFSGNVAGQTLLTSGDVIRLGSNTREDPFIVTRFDLQRQNGNAVTEPNNYLQAAGDPDIGLRDMNNNGIADVAYVTGTGAHDRITLSDAGGGVVNVQVDAFIDAARTSLIASESYSINLATQTDGTILVDASINSDEVIVDATIDAIIRVRGGTGEDGVASAVDTLVVNGSGLSGSYTPSGSDGGQLAFGGGVTIVATELELDGGIEIDDVGTMTLVGGASGDDIAVQRASGSIRVDGDLGGDDFVPLLLTNITTLGIDTLGGTDTLTIDNSSGVVATNINFDGGVSAGDNDALIITGNPGAAVARETYRVGATQDAGVWTVDPNGNMGAGATGAASGDELIVTFANLEPVDSDIPATNFDVIFSTGGDNASVTNGGSLAGFSSLQVTDIAGTFETFRFARKTNVRLMGNGGVDQISVDYTSAAAGLATLEVFGHAAAGVGGVGADDSAVDSLHVLRNSAGVVHRLFGGGGSDLLVVGNGSLLGISAPVQIEAGAGLNDSLVLDDSARLAGQEYEVDSIGVALVNGGVTSIVAYNATLEFVRLNGTQGADTFRVTPSAFTQFFIDGNDPSTLPGDFLEINFAGTTGRVLTKVGSDGMWEFSNRETVMFEEIEEFNYFPITAIGAEAGPQSRSAVQVYDAELNDPQVKFFAYGKSFKGGSRVAVGDITGDGIPEIITAPGAGRAALVKVFDLLSGKEVYDYRIRAYESSFKNGAYVAVGDVTGDGLNDIITSPGPGRTVHIRIWENQIDVNPTTPFETLQWFGFRAFGGTFAGGGTVAAGDLTGDGRAEIVVGNGPGMAPRIRVYDISTVDPLPNPGFISLLPFIYEIRPFSKSDRGGVFVAMGNVRGDATPEIIAGNGVGGRGRVEMYNADGSRFKSLNAYANLGGGANPSVRVAVVDVDGDGVGEIVTGEGLGGTRERRMFEADASLVDSIFESDLDFRHGFFVA